MSEQQSRKLQMQFLSQVFFSCLIVFFSLLRYMFASANLYWGITGALAIVASGQLGYTNVQKRKSYIACKYCCDISDKRWSLGKCNNFLGH